MAEFVKVLFPTTRTVHVDGAPYGKTNTVLSVERGTHHFDLGVPRDYAPPECIEKIVGTTQEHPVRD